MGGGGEEGSGEGVGVDGGKDENAHTLPVYKCYQLHGMHTHTCTQLQQCYTQHTHMSDNGVLDGPYDHPPHLLDGP